MLCEKNILMLIQTCDMNPHSGYLYSVEFRSGKTEKIEKHMK